jgi:hypothetical protein
MADSKFGETLENVWADYVHCDRAAVAAKSELDGSRFKALVGLNLSAVLGVLSSQMIEVLGPLQLWLKDATPYAQTIVRHLQQGEAIGFLSAIAAVIGTLNARKVLGLGLEHDWVLARASAESAKSQALRFLARAAPYDSADPAENAAKLSAKAAEYRENMPQGQLEDFDETQRLNGLPADWLTMENFLDLRVREQLKFFKRRGLEHGRKAARLRDLIGWLGALSAGLGAFHQVKHIGPLTAWVAVFASLSTAVGAYIVQNRLLYLTKSYDMNAKRLERLLEAWGLVPAAEKAAKQGEFVNKFEDVLSVENRQWVTEFDKSALSPSPAPATPPMSETAPSEA